MKRSIENQQLSFGARAHAGFLAGRERSRARPRDRTGATLRLIALVVVVVLAITLRVVYLNAVGYNSDEAVYAGQGAAVAEVPVLEDIFPVFRAHPMLFQFLIAVAFKFAASDLLARLLSATIGVATVLVVFALGNRLYGFRAGFYAALFMALMPYHVIVTRQVLLDGPMVLCSTLSLYMMARLAETHRPVWLYAAAAGIGLTFLSKEIGFIMVGAIYAFLALSPSITLRLRHLALSLVVLVTIMAPFPLSVILAGGGGGSKTTDVLIWQLFRRPNHTWDFYFLVVPPALGYLVIATALAGLWFLRADNSWREKLLVLWILVPVVFFELWPTKGFQYLLPTAPAFALLAARSLAHWPGGGARVFGLRLSARTLGAVTVGVVALTLVVPSWQRVTPSQSATFLAGSGGVPGGREAGQWIRENVPEGATFLAIGPSMANIIKWYARHRAFGISVSTNPLHRNPSYQPVHNPDFQIRIGEIQYLVWDSFSAERTSFFSEKLLGYVQKYNGRAVHTETVTVRSPSGEPVEKPVIVIYEVHP